jgi:hypothetical protein
VAFLLRQVDVVYRLKVSSVDVVLSAAITINCSGVARCCKRDQQNPLRPAFGAADRGEDIPCHRLLHPIDPNLLQGVEVVEATDSQ